MTLDDEIKDKLLSLNFPTKIIDDWQHLANKLSSRFDWIGSKIDWSKTINHRTESLEGSYPDWILKIKNFISNNIVNNVIQSAEEIYYINDSSLDFAISFFGEDFNSFLSFILENIPQHHYFFDFNINWCLMISSEGYVDFGFTK